MRLFPAITLLALTLLAAPLLVAITAATAFAQTPPDIKVFTSSKDIKALIAKAKADHKEGAPLTVEPLLLLAPYHTDLEYRTGTAPSAVHETEAELMYVIEGAGTITIGGKLTDEKRINPTNLRGTSIEGGTPTPIAKGDFLIVPEKTAHQIAPKGSAIVVMTMHVPRPIPTP